MALDQGTLQHLYDWADKHHGGPPACPFCSGSNGWEQWLINIIRPVVFDRRITLNDAGYGMQPNAALEFDCAVCGYRMTFDASIIGVPLPQYAVFSGTPASDGAAVVAGSGNPDSSSE